MAAYGVCANEVDVTLGWRTLYLATALGLVATLSWGLEQYLSDPLHRADSSGLPPDQAGRGLYLLLVDSLAPADVETMTAVGALRDGGFSGIVEPCADNYTVPCTYELLTGRSTFSLFSFLENMGVIEGNSGPSLITDAREAGWDVAVISRHDMDAWGALATSNIHVTRAQRDTELRVGLEAAAEHRLVFHHYVWHDVVSHRHPRGHAKYQKSLDAVEQLIVGLEAGLPDDMDLLITGDHGHLDDGRHLQGLDTPTEVILRSPNVLPQRVSERIPMPAIRWLAGAATGLGTNTARVAPEWRDWVHPGLGETLRSSGAPLDPSTDDRGAPWLAIGSALLLLAVAAGALGWKVGVVVWLWGLLLGMAYPGTHAANIEGWGPRAYIDYTVALPAVGGLVGLLYTRSVEAAWRAVVLTSLGFGLVLWPVLGSEGIPRNAETILMPGAVAAALVLAWRAVRSPAARSARTLGWVGVLVAAVVLSADVLSLLANDVRIRRMPLTWLAEDYTSWLIPSGALAAGLAQALTRPRWLPVLAATVALPLGTVLPVPLQAVAFLVTTGGFLALSGPRRHTWLIPALALCSGFMFEPHDAAGVLLSSLAAGATMVGALAVFRSGAHDAARSAVVWMGALALSIGTFMGMAWTLRLSVAGVDFGFILRWLPEGWHEPLWFVIFAACFVKTFLPALVLHTVLHARAGALLNQMVARAMGITVLRAIFTGVFSLGWVLSQGPSAGTRRLIRVLQQGYGWLFIAMLLWILLAMHRRLQGGAATASNSDAGDTGTGLRTV